MLGWVVLIACSPSTRSAATRAPAPAPVAKQEQAAVANSEIRGVVLAADGAPVVDGVVAINGVKGETLSVVRTDAHGRFEAVRPPGRFGITVTSAAGMGAFIPPGDAAAKHPLRIRLPRSSEGLTIAGTLSVAAQGVPAERMMFATRFSSEEGDIFAAPVSASGAFTFVVPPGTYSLRPNPEQLLASWSRARGAAGERQTVDVVASELGPPPQEVVRWLRQEALPISTTDPASPTDDIASLAKTLATARVIGVGEATHGTREYFRLKHRLLERLVTHHGLTLLAMEANFGEAERIDAWLRTGEGTVEDALKGLVVVWRTEEVRDLLLWMRAWNVDPAHKTKLRFRGYDVQRAGASISTLRAYLGRVDPRVVEELLAPLAPLEAPGLVALDADGASQLGDGAAALSEHLSKARRRYIGRSSAAEYSLMLQHARVVEQARRRAVAEPGAEQFVERDRAMAENVIWLSEQLPKDERVLVWAHNGHVQLDASSLLGPNMGTRLRAQLGADYLAAGFVLGEGTYRAWVKRGAPDIADVAVGPRQLEWTAEAFARVGPASFAVDLRSVPVGVARDWLFSPHVLHSCGWLVSEQEVAGSVDALGRLFDVAIYVGDTTSARQLGR